MGKLSKPWLNYKSHEEDVIIPKREYKTLRSYKKALLLLIFLGFSGGHRFYLYDEKRGWRILGGYSILIIAASFLKPFLVFAPYLVLLCYAISIILSDYSGLRQNVDRVNQEILND